MAKYAGQKLNAKRIQRALKRAESRKRKTSNIKTLKVNGKTVYYNSDGKTLTD